MERFKNRGKNAVFKIKQKKHVFFEKNLVIQSYIWWIYLDLGLSLVHIGMQNYQIRREWSEADWLDPLITFETCACLHC